MRCDPDEVRRGQLHTSRAETFRVRLRSGSNGTGVNNSGTQAGWQIIRTEANLPGRGTARLQDGAALHRRTPLSVLVYRFRAGGLDRLVANVIRNGERAVLVLHTRGEKCAERSGEDIRVRMCVPPPLPSRINWTRLVPRPVLNGHVSSPPVLTKHV